MAAGEDMKAVRGVYEFHFCACNFSCGFPVLQQEEGKDHMQSLDNVANYAHHTSNPREAFIQKINTIQCSMNPIFAKSQHVCR